MERGSKKTPSAQPRGGASNAGDGNETRSKPQEEEKEDSKTLVLGGGPEVLLKTIGCNSRRKGKNRGVSYNKTLRESAAKPGRGVSDCRGGAPGRKKNGARSRGF